MTSTGLAVGLFFAGFAAGLVAAVAAAAVALVVQWLVVRPWDGRKATDHVDWVWRLPNAATSAVAWQHRLGEWLTGGLLPPALRLAEISTYMLRSQVRQRQPTATAPTPSPSPTSPM